MAVVDAGVPKPTTTPAHPIRALKSRLPGAAPLGVVPRKPPRRQKPQPRPRRQKVLLLRKLLLLRKRQPRLLIRGRLLRCGSLLPFLVRRVR